MKKHFPHTVITVSIPNHKELDIGTLISIITRTRVPRTEFE